MTIKEAEKLTGMPRASIRFYEAESLIRPQREKNGYRVYTQENVDDLLRIRLLRLLNVSIEEIRSLAEGQLTLRDCLGQHTARLEETRARSVRSAEICRRLMEETADFRSLDAALWLSRLEGGQSVSAPEQKLPPKPGLWRRFFARLFDYTLYVLLWELLLAGVFRVNLTGGVTKDPTLLMQILENVAVMVCIMAFEPLFLWRWGTTPGKWIMGIRVTDDKGARLVYREAVLRCGTLLVYGYGLGIPVVTLIRQIVSLRNVWRGEEPEWEWDSRLQLQEKSCVRSVVLCLSCAALLMISQTWIRLIPEIPPNRGTVTVEEFAENFNALQRYYEEGTNDYIFSGDMRELAVRIPWQLDSSGSWTAREDEDFYAWIHSGEPPELVLHFGENGVVSGVTLSFRAEWDAGAESDDARRGRDFQRHIFLMRVAAQAFGGAQTGYLMPFGSWNTTQELVANGWRQDYAFSLRNIAIAYDVELSGCAPVENGAPKLEKAADAEHCWATYSFTIRLEK